MPARHLCSENKQTLVTPTFAAKTYGERRFQFAAPHLWNDLSVHIKQATTISSFKTLLKNISVKLIKRVVCLVFFLFY